MHPVLRIDPRAAVALTAMVTPEDARGRKDLKHLTNQIPLGEIVTTDAALHALASCAYKKHEPSPEAHRPITNICL